MTFAGNVHPFSIDQMRNSSLDTPAPILTSCLSVSVLARFGMISIWLKSVGGALTLLSTSAELPVAVAIGSRETRICESEEYRFDQVCRKPATRTRLLEDAAWRTIFWTPPTVVGT